MKRISLFAVIPLLAMSLPVQAGSIYEATILADNPVLHFSFSNISGGGTIVEDSSPNNNDGSVLGTFTFNGESALPGAPGGVSASTAGLGQIIATGAAGLDETFSVSFWSKPTQLANWNQILNGGGGGWGRWLWHSSLLGDVYTGGGNCCGTRFTALPGVLVEDEWGHYVYTFNENGGGVGAGRATVYKNGVPIATKTGMDKPSDGLGPWTQLEIGQSGSNTIHGLIDEVSIFDYELTAAQVATHYAAASLFIIPEPSTFLLAALGMVPVSNVRRRQRK